VSFEDSSERWMVLGAGLFEGKIRAVIATLDGGARGVSIDKVQIKPGQMKLFYVLQGDVALRHAGTIYRISEGDSALWTAEHRTTGTTSAGVARACSGSFSVEEREP